MKEVDPTDTRGAHDPGVSNGEDTPNFNVLRLFAVSQGCNLDSGKTNQAREGRDEEFKFEYAPEGHARGLPRSQCRNKKHTSSRAAASSLW